MKLPALLFSVFVAIAHAPAPAAADPMLADFAYPHPVKTYAFRVQEMDLRMAYMDVAPSAPKARAVVLLHGKNFCAATWEGVIAAVTAAGYRTIAPDQIGFCKSDKPRGYTYGLHELAANTHGLLGSLGVEKPILVGHSMGGMLAVRYALSFPEAIAGLVLINPIGLEDWRAEGVPELTLDALLAAERATTAERIRAYQQKVYYGGQWKPDYDRWVDMLASMYQGPGGESVAWAQAKTSRMVFSDPVIYELERLKVPVALLIGGKDTTAIGRDRAPPDLAARLGNYPELARKAAQRLGHGAWFELWPELGHSPHIEAPQIVHPLLLEVLSSF